MKDRVGKVDGEIGAARENEPDPDIAELFHKFTLRPFNEKLSEPRIRPDNVSQSKLQHPSASRSSQISRFAVSRSYDHRSLQNFRRLPFPQPLLIVFDLNGTLIYRLKRNRGSRKIIKRPSLHTFLDEIFSTPNFRIIIWSSAERHNVSRILNQILSPHQLTNLLDVWTRDQLQLTAAQFSNKVPVYKKLSLIWSNQHLQSSYPVKSPYQNSWNQFNTVLVDDTQSKAAYEPWNLLHVPEFKPDSTLPNSPSTSPIVSHNKFSASISTAATKPGDHPQTSHPTTNSDSVIIPPCHAHTNDTLPHDNVLPQVLAYLRNLAWYSNVSSFMRQHPFRYTISASTQD